MRQNIAVIFGGDSAEHEVSIITGLQAFEKIDKDKYAPFALYLKRNGEFAFFPEMESRKDFNPKGGKSATLGRDNDGAFISFGGIVTAHKIYLHSALLALHGGTGENGSLQGMLEILDIPYTSSGVEGSAVAMNKAVTKEVLANYRVPTIPGKSIFFPIDIEKAAAELISELQLPVIVKPVHLGSSIGLAVANTEVELQKALQAASLIDSEVVVEKFLQNFKEFNCSVRSLNGEIIASAVERPINKDEILSFADKYQRGGKKTGGMASLGRELPAQISEELANTIQEMVKKVYKVCRLRGMCRIDLIQTASGEVLVNEINPIPGSLSFYLWEATGTSFTQLLSEMLDEAKIENEKKRSRRLTYTSDIVEKFVNA